MIGKPTFGEASANDHFWPQAVIGLAVASEAGIDPRLPFTIDAADVRNRIEKPTLPS